MYRSDPRHRPHPDQLLLLPLRRPDPHQHPVLIHIENRVGPVLRIPVVDHIDIPVILLETEDHLLPDIVLRRRNQRLPFLVK